MKQMIAKIRAALDAGDTEAAMIALDKAEAMYSEDMPDGKSEMQGEEIAEGEDMETEDEYGIPLKRRGMRPKEQSTMADYFATKKVAPV